jgi:hypothetical protein
MPLQDKTGNIDARLRFSASCIDVLPISNFKEWKRYNQSLVNRGEVLRSADLEQTCVACAKRTPARRAFDWLLHLG